MATINDDRPIPGADLEAMFRPPPPPTGPLMDDPTSSSSTSPQTTDSRPANPFGIPSLKPGTADDTRTHTSPTSGSPRGDARAAGKAVLAIVGALVLLVDALLVRTAHRRLRRPTRAQMTALSTPAGRIAYRHGGAAVLGEDVGDVIDMTGAVADYLLDDKPLTYAGPRVEYADEDPDDVDDVDQAAPAPAPRSFPPPFGSLPLATPAAAAPPTVTFLP